MIALSVISTTTVEKFLKIPSPYRSPSPPKKHAKVWRSSFTCCRHAPPRMCCDHDQALNMSLNFIFHVSNNNKSVKERVSLSAIYAQHSTEAPSIFTSAKT